jgi:probable F420-dependent oxidoreductase
MPPVKVHLMTGALPLREMQTLARRAAEAGFAGLVVTEAGRTAYLACAAAALSGAGIDLATGVAVAFPRSPMVTAQVAWELAEATGGRFRLGLGSQVRAHVERRYSSPFDPPGPRLREYVLAVRAAFAAFRGAPLAFEGRHYRLSLLPPAWSPGPLPGDLPDPPIDIAAVNPWMLRMAAEVADGVHVHPINTAAYYEATLLPNLAAAGRRLTLFVPLFTPAGATPAERAPLREAARTMVAFYGSTPNYAFVFDQLGRPGTTDAIRARQKVGDVPGMAGVIDDELLGHFVVEGTWGELPDRIAERVGPLVEAGHDVQVVLYQGGTDIERFGAVAAALR